MKRNYKDYHDELSMNTRAYQKRREEYKKYGAEGVEELMSKGNLKEAAVVFSLEGMKAFSTMFGNSIEKSVENVLSNNMDKIVKAVEDRIESAVESKMKEVLEGMTEGMRKFAEDRVVSKVSEEITSHVEDVEVNSKDLVEVQKPEVNEEGAEHTCEAGSELDTSRIQEDAEDEPLISRIQEESMDEDDIRTVGSKESDIESILPIVKEFIKSSPKPVKLSDITSELSSHSIKLINPTVTLKKCIKKDPNIEKVGYGLYTYRENNFKPLL